MGFCFLSSLRRRSTLLANLAEMRNALFRRLVQGTFYETRSKSVLEAANPSPLPFSNLSRRYAVSSSVVEEEAETVTFTRDGPGVSYGLNWALAGRGVIVKDKAFHNLKPFELQQIGATPAGNATGGALEISKAQFSKLLKQVTSHISAISKVFIQDGAIGSSPKCDAKVHVISDSPSAALSLSNVLWRTPTRAVSHDTCPLTVYVATSISPSIGEAIVLGSQANAGFVAADIERSSIILCGKAFADTQGTKGALAAVATPVISSRGGLPLSARFMVSGDSVILMFAPESVLQSCSELREIDAGVVLSSQGVSPYFQTKEFGAPSLFKMPSSVILASADRCSSMISKLSPGQAAYHFLAGYQNGNFIPAYNPGPSPVNPLDLAKALLPLLKDNGVSTFLINVNEGEKQVTGKKLVKLIELTLSESLPPFESQAGELSQKYKSFISGKFQDLSEEFSF